MLWSSEICEYLKITQKKICLLQGKRKSRQRLAESLEGKLQKNKGNYQSCDRKSLWSVSSQEKLMRRHVTHSVCVLSQTRSRQNSGTCMEREAWFKYGLNKAKKKKWIRWTLDYLLLFTTVLSLLSQFPSV